MVIFIHENYKKPLVEGYPMPGIFEGAGTDKKIPAQNERALNLF